MSFFVIEWYNLIITRRKYRTEQKLSLEKTVEGHAQVLCGSISMVQTQWHVVTAERMLC